MVSGRSTANHGLVRTALWKCYVQSNTEMETFGERGCLVAYKPWLPTNLKVNAAKVALTVSKNATRKKVKSNLRRDSIALNDLGLNVLI